MVSFPNCKINLGLYITRKRDDGYHDLETVFYPVDLKDALEVVPAPVTTLYMSGLPVAGTQADNLVLKAWQLLHDLYPAKVPTLEIYLHKAIPMGAGMGGGSADGAFMLRLLNDYCNLGLTANELIPLALKLGSDCPFFILNTPQFATGRGELMLPVEISLSAYSLQLVCPKVHVSTAKAFGLITPRLAPYDLQHIASLPIEQWKDNISNDFEAPVFGQHPGLAAIKAQLYTQGAIYASMSGSGSTLFGIFPKGVKAEITSTLEFETYYIH